MEDAHAHRQAAGVPQGDGVGPVIFDDAVGLPARPEQLLLVDRQRENVQQRLDCHACQKSQMQFVSERNGIINLPLAVWGTTLDDVC